MPEKVNAPQKLLGQVEMPKMVDAEGGLVTVDGGLDSRGEDSGVEDEDVQGPALLQVLCRGRLH